MSATLVLLVVWVGASAAVAQEGEGVAARVERALVLIRENRVAEAEQQLSSVLKVAPNEASALNLLGAIRAQQARFGEAETLFARAVRSDPQFVGAHMNLAYLYLLKGLPEKTVAELKEVVRLDPNHAEATYKLARLLLSQNRVDECIGFVEKVKQSQTVPAALLVVLGDAYRSRGDFDKAEANYLLALDAQSNNTDASLGLAEVARSRGDARNVSLYLARAKNSAVASPELLYKYALVALGSGLYEEANVALLSAVEHRPDEPSFLLALGATWLKKPDLIEAERVFRRFLKLLPDDARGQMYLGYVLLKQKKYAEAREWLERSVKTDTSMPEAFYYLALIAQEQNEDARAVELLEKVVGRLPAYTHAHVALGASYMKMKNYVRARESLELAVRLNPEEPKAHYNLAMLFARLKDQQRSQEHMRIVERLKNRNAATAQDTDAPAHTVSPNPL
jgi:tetratricopeptide (TPR) repeat protein